VQQKATGVAARVAEERGETQPGTASVGYVVRGNSAFSKDTRMLFCTFGILLRQLQSEGALNSVTHIVIDEVHERNLDGDILMGLLREALKTVPHLKVILMSATLDADRFAAYWGNAPRMHIPGRTFPVEDFMLEDVLEKTGYNPPKKKRKQGGFNNFSRNRKANAWNDSEVSDDEMEDEDEPAAVKNSDESENKQTEVPLEERVKRVDQTSVDYFLLAFLIKYIVQTNQMGSDGSILVFLQGVGEISQAQTVIGNITKDMNILLLPLHGSLQPQEQSKIFRKTYGQVKVILSTNVAETSITIPDCTVVIDSCREKQSSYDPINRMPMLLDQFASKASLKQRRGRAGRVRSGKCYKLISKATHSKLPEHTAPEISRCALDQTLLSLLFLGAEDGSGRFLQNLLDPPSEASVKAATASLQKMGALEQAEPGKLCLSPLGMHLAGIPAPPTIGKCKL
jgi:HrpA-like RNA helicase